MSDVIQLTSPHDRASSPVATTAFYFDLASPHTYLVAERVERRFGDAAWQPAVLAGPPDPNRAEGARVLARLEQRARDLRLPLVWPERYPQPVPAAMRVATFAAERGVGAAFAIAAGRLAFCGGFDVEDPAILADAAAAAGLDVKEALAAAGDARRDALSGAAGRGLRSEHGVVLPALQHEEHLYCGEDGITTALVVHTRTAEPPSVA